MKICLYTKHVQTHVKKKLKFFRKKKIQKQTKICFWFFYKENNILKVKYSYVIIMLEVSKLYF